MSSFSRFIFTYLALVSPPVALAIDVFARSLTEIGRADDEDLEAVRPGLRASPRTGRDAHRVPFPELDDLVVDLHPPAPAHDHVHVLLRLVRVDVRKAIAGRDALVAEGGFVELERLGRSAELQVRRAVEVGAEVVQILLDVAEREGHGAILWRRGRGSFVAVPASFGLGTPRVEGGAPTALFRPRGLRPARAQTSDELTG